MLKILERARGRISSLALCVALFLALRLPSGAQQARTTNWTPAANRMSDERWAPAACALADGRTALVAGGFSYKAKACVSSIDLFDETVGRFRRSRARLTYPRDFAQASLLPDGRVLISGGYNDVWASMSIAEIYDPSTDTCRLARGRMHQRRELFQAVTLDDHQILLCGGLDLWARGTVASAELFDPATELFTPTPGAMTQDRFGFAACRLRDGRVLIAGGTHWSLRKKETRVLDSAELFDPATGRFTPAAGHLHDARDRPTASLLSDGAVLIYGGQGARGASVTTAELFDPATMQFAVAPLPAQASRMAHDVVSLPSGDVVISGGWNAQVRATTGSTALFDPSNGRLEALGDLPFASHDAAGVVFADGAVLIAGGKIVAGGKEGSNDLGAVLRPPTHGEH